MQHFKHFLKDKLRDPSFRDLFDRECHVCRNTLRIFQKMSREKCSMEKMAATLDVDTQSLQLLRDADYCDPDIVVRLCRELDLPLPEECPRR